MVSYLVPPPNPQPVIVTKDVGGFVNEYQAATELYRATNREVRLHECRSACTLALSLPNVCVYRDSVLKFHLAYDPRNHESNYAVSQQLFSSYPAPIRARLGGLTRDYRVLRGEELIALGVRDCEAPRRQIPAPAEPKIMLASATVPRTATSARALRQPEPEGSLSSLYNGIMSAFGLGETSPQQPFAAVRARPRPVPAQPGLFGAEVPVPPARPIEIETDFASLRGDGATVEAEQIGQQPAEQTAGVEIPAPPPRPELADLAYTAEMRQRVLPRVLPLVIHGAQPILPAAFVAYADLARARVVFASAPGAVANGAVSDLLFKPSDL